MTTMSSPVLAAAQASGAQSGPWGDWELATGFGYPAAEYRAAHQATAVHDTSYLGRIKATGPDVLDLLNRLSTNRVDPLPPGSGAATVLTNEKGRILDLVYVFNLGPYILLLTSPGREEAVAQWLDRFTFIEDIATEPITSSTALITLAGPKSPETLAMVAPGLPATPEPLQVVHATLDGAQLSIIRLDLAGIPCFHIMASVEHAESVWNAAAACGAVPVGEDVWQVLRVEAGVPAYGKELGEAFNPLETGLIGGIDFAKGCYIGQEVIARLDTYDKVQRALVRLSLDDAVPAQEGAKLLSEGKEVGVLTSLARVPATGALLGLGYARRAAAVPGHRLTLAGSNVPSVEVLDLPLLLGEEQS